MLQILATAASNMAVDNMVEKLLKANPKLNILRIGHPARILPQASFPNLKVTQRLDTHVSDVDRSARVSYAGTALTDVYCCFETWTSQDVPWGSFCLRAMSEMTFQISLNLGAVKSESSLSKSCRKCMQVLDNCLEVATAKSDSGKNAKSCAADIKAANAKMLKLGHRVACISNCLTAQRMTPDVACICKDSAFLSRWKP